MARSETIIIRVHEDEKKQLQDAANVLGVSLSDVVRLKLNDQL